MSQDNLRVVEAIYRDWRDGLRPSRSPHLHPDIEWVNPPDAVETGTRRGAQAYDEALDAVERIFGTIRIEVEQMVGADDEVVVVGTFTGQGEGSGTPVVHRQGYVWTVRDGRAVRFQWFNDPAEAFSAAGLDPADGS